MMLFIPDALPGPDTRQPTEEELRPFMPDALGQTAIDFHLLDEQDRRNFAIGMWRSATRRGAGI